MWLLTKQQQETTPAGTGNFATKGASVERRRIGFIDQRIRDLGRDFLFCQPALMQQFSKCAKVCFAEGVLHLLSGASDIVHRFERLWIAPRVQALLFF